MSDNFKLFVWTEDSCGQPILEQYISGMIFAFAHNLKEAKEAVLKNIDYEDVSSETIEEIKKILSLQCIIYDKPFGLFILGSS